MVCRALRGATTADGDSPAEILDATRELLAALIAANGLQPDDIASAIFSATPDLCAAFPAQAARDLGWKRTALLDTVEMAVPGALPRCVRVLIHFNTARAPGELRHIYLKEAAQLRPDLAGDPPQAGENAGNEASRIVLRSHSAGGPPVVAYQGEPGAYSQEAIQQFFGPETPTLACPSFEHIFTAVEERQATFGLLPIENSKTGSIHQAYDLLLDHDLQVVGEVKLRVRHCLLVVPGTDVNDVVRVRSHPQALAQVERYLKRHGWQAEPAYDTGGAARELAASRQPGTAAVASALAGKIYGLTVLETGVEDAPDNTTRFFLLSRGAVPSGVRATAAEAAGGTVAPPGAASDVTPFGGQPRCKTSLVFATSHTPGSLHRALAEFASRDLNLTKIESRPRHNQPWHYVFYLDFEGHWLDPSVSEALVALLANAAFVKLLGSYPAAE